MKNYRIWLIIVLILFLINSVALVLIWFHRQPSLRAEYPAPLQQHMEPKDILTQTLAFTPKQALLFDTMRTRHRQLVNKLEQKNHLLKDSLFANIKKDKADSLVINAITKKISDNQAQIEKATLYHFRELRTILTTAQKNKFDAIINQVLQMMGRPNGMPPPPRDNDGMDRRPDGERPHNMPVGSNWRRMHHGPPPDGMQPDTGRRDGRFGPPPNGMPPPPPGDRRRGHRPPPPPPGGMPPGPDGPPN